MASIPEYAELRCVSNFTFLRGASQPEELVARAKQLGYTALTIADECSMAGIVRAHVAAKEHDLKLLVGSQFLVEWGLAAAATTTPFVLTVLACNLHGYGNLCQFITKLRRSSEKGTYQLDISNISGAELEDCVVLASPKRMAEPEQLATVARWLLDHFLGRCWFGVDLLRLLDDEMWLHRLREVSGFSAIPLVAAGDVHFHVRSRKPLQDVLTATRVGRPLTECGLDLQPNAERHLRTRLRLAQRPTRPPCWQRRSTWPRAASSISTSCATSTRMKWCPPARPRPRTCGASPTRAQAGAGPRACRPRSSRKSSTSSNSSAT